MDRSAAKIGATERIDRGRRPTPRHMAWMIIAAAAATGCDALDTALSRNADLLARADGHELTITQVVDLFAIDPQLPNQRELVEGIGNLWMDYTLLATSFISDSLAQSLDLEPLIRTQVEQTLVYRLRDQVIQVDTIFTEDDLRRLFDTRGPGVEIRARHILVTYPANATPAQQDSVGVLARDLRRRALAGANFADLAREHSQDPGSAPDGGDLGFFGRGEMTAPFEQAAFALEVGEISDLVESPFGVHVIRLEERRTPEFENLREQFLEEMKSQRILAAESTYIAGLVDPANVTVPEGAPEVVRQLAQRPTNSLARRAARRPLTTYEGGTLTAQEFLDFLRGRPPAFRGQVAAAPDDPLRRLLRDLTQAELLVNEAREQGIDVTEDERSAMMGDARAFIVAAAERIGLRRIQPTDGESRDAALERKVLEAVGQVLRGEEEVVPLGIVAFTLRDRYDNDFYDFNIARILDLIGAARGAQTPPAQTPDSLVPAPNAPPTSP